MTEPTNEPLHNALALEELIRANNASNDTMRRLVDHVRRETDARDRKIDVLERNHREMRWLTLLNVGAVVVLLVLALFNASNIMRARKNAAQTAQIAADARQTNVTLLDCLNATGKCGKANQVNQKRVLDEVKRYELTTIYCARSNPQPIDADGKKFIACITRLYPDGPVLTGR